MQVKYAPHLEALWKLAGEIGTLGETDPRYATVYIKLSEALDNAELSGLVKYEEE